MDLSLGVVSPVRRRERCLRLGGSGRPPTPPVPPVPTPSYMHAVFTTPAPISSYIHTASTTTALTTPVTRLILDLETFIYQFGHPPMLFMVPCHFQKCFCFCSSPIISGVGKFGGKGPFLQCKFDQKTSKSYNF